MRIGQKTRRRLIALTVAMAGSFALALGVKAWDGPDWVTVPLIAIGLLALGALLMLCDAVTCAADNAQPDIDWSACKRVRRARSGATGMVPPPPPPFSGFGLKPSNE